MASITEKGKGTYLLLCDTSPVICLLFSKFKEQSLLAQFKF